LKIIEDIIDLSKIEANQLQIQEKEFNLNELLDELNTIFDKEIQTERKHSLTLTLSKELPDEKANVKLDKTRLQQILTNLLSNAIKYTESGKIEFGYKLVKSSSWYYLQFYVSDTGIGIPEDKQDIVFDRFRQSDDSQTRSYGGTGLGLSISKALIEKMGGTIWLDSEPDSGTVLYFVLPLLNYNEQMMDHTQNSVEPMNVNWKGKQILIVEDDVLSVKFLEAILEGTGAETIHVKRGQNAIDMVKSKRIDLILMDIQLPGMDGNEATAQIRKFNDEVPIIAQTAHAMSEDKRKSIQSGCNDYITKPIDSNLLLVKIKEQFIKRE
jgi:CheY-like chemotaxis protein/anti-sigma regulatory factor (Ser/Thr protein kinase)